MKKTILFVLFLTQVVCYSQVKTGVIVYTVIAENETATIADTAEASADVIPQSERATYTLVFSPEESYFYANPAKSATTGPANSHGNQMKLYQNKKKREYREYVDCRKGGPVILNKKALHDWAFLPETKMIDGYRCYKAAGPNEVTAWYCPQLPVESGPLGYGELPGLILELQCSALTFTAGKIDLNPEKLPAIDRLTSPKAISEEAYKEMHALHTVPYESGKTTDTSENR